MIGPIKQKIISVENKTLKVSVPGSVATLLAIGCVHVLTTLRWSPIFPFRDSSFLHWGYLIMQPVIGVIIRREVEVYLGGRTVRLLVRQRPMHYLQEKGGFHREEFWMATHFRRIWGFKMTKCIGLNIPNVISKCYSFPTTMSTWHRGIDETGNCLLFGVLLFL